MDLVKVDGILKFTDGTVQRLAVEATKKSGSGKVMLGKFGEGGIYYTSEAENFGCSYYDLSQWNELKNLINGDKKEMWKINKQFILNNKGNTFYMCHNPDQAKDFFKDEIDLIKNWDGFRVFIKEGPYWKAVFD